MGDTDERNQRCGISNIIGGLTVMMSNAHGRKHMRMNNGQFEALADDPVGPAL